MRTIILDHQRIDRIIKRIAHQVVEHCYTQDRIIVVGIKPRGTWVADQIVAQLKDIAPMQIDQHTIDVDAIDSASLVAAKIKGQYVVLVDDVIKSGHTMMLAASALMKFEPSMLITASLVDRKHRKFPIQSDFTGLSLATTIQEHLKLEIKPKPTLYLE